MKKMILSLLISIIALSISGSSYAENKDISPAKSKDIEKLLDLTITDALVETWVNSLMRVFTKVASAARTTEEKEVIAIISESVREVIVAEFPKMKEQYIPLYDEYYTHEEIKKLNEFYQTPVGQKSIKVLPILTQRRMKLGKRWGASLIPKIYDNLRKKDIEVGR
jgi:hypothetical protein